MIDPDLCAGIELNVAVSKDRHDEFNKLRSKIRMRVSAGVAEEWEIVLNMMSKLIIKMKTIIDIREYLFNRDASYIYTARGYVGKTPEKWISAIAPFIEGGCILLNQGNYKNIDIYAYRDGKVYTKIGWSLCYGTPIVYKYDKDGNWVYDKEASVRDDNYGKRCIKR